jgi:hypothetical protein
MKKEIPPAAIWGLAAVAIAAVVFVFMRFTGSNEITKEPERLPGYTDEIPAYVKEGRAPRADEIPQGAGGGPQGSAPAGAPAPGAAPR